MPFPVIADSGANFHMFKEREFFSHLIPASGRVLLGDGKAVLSIQGIGTVQCFIDGHLLTLENVRYIPDLSESIYSLFLHIQHPNHGLQSSFESGLFVSFPNFTTKALIGEHDIYLNMIPTTSNFQSKGGTSSNYLLPMVSIPEESVCINFKQFQSDIQRETDYFDNLLEELRHYYETVKTRHQLNLEIPAGFRETTRHVKQFRHHLSTLHEMPNDVIMDHTSPSDVIPTNHIENIDLSSQHESSDNTNTSSSPDNIPIIWSVDKPSS